LRAGIDPTGGANPYAHSVVWSEPMRSEDTWGQLSVQATAQGESVTVFVFSAPKYPVLHNEVYLDDARLVVVGQEEGPTPTPEPTATPAPPEHIPEPDTLEDPFAVSDPFPLENEVVSGPLVYSIQPGDTLATIAEQFDVDVAELADANGLTEGDIIYVAGQLIIPNLTFVAPETVARYTMQPGDTLGEIAFAFDTTIYTLAQLNGIVSYEQVKAGTEILVPIDAGSGAVPGGLTSHTVEPGESLTRIGLRYNTPSQAIASANHLGNSAFVYPGQTLVIP
jgi:LysM repeat protein